MRSRPLAPRTFSTGATEAVSGNSFGAAPASPPIGASRENRRRIFQPKEAMQRRLLVLLCACLVWAGWSFYALANRSMRGRHEKTLSSVSSIRQLPFAFLAPPVVPRGLPARAHPPSVTPAPKAVTPPPDLAELPDIHLQQTFTLLTRQQQIQVLALNMALKTGAIQLATHEAKNTYQKILESPQDHTVLVKELPSVSYAGSHSSMECLGFRATHDCSPDGDRYPDHDRICSAVLPHQKASGYCEVLDFRNSSVGEIRQVMRLHCNSLRQSWVFTGKATCGDAEEFAMFDERSTSFKPKALPDPGHSDSRDPQLERGIVFCVADSLMVSAYVSIRILREHGCQLPIELWYFPSEMGGSEPLVDELVYNYSVTVRPVLVPRNAICHSNSQKCFNIKIHAIYYTRFRSVLMMDTDNFAVRDPTYLFDSPEFRKTGALFWPDYWHPGNTVFNIEPISPLWELTGIPYVDMFEQESGQLLINKTGNSAALDILMFYASPNNILYRYTLAYGDKDLFRLAFLKAGSPFHMMRRPPGFAGYREAVTSATPEGFFCGMTMVQYDASDRILFLHRNGIKIGRHGSGQREIWKDLVEFVGEDPGEFQCPVWIPFKKRRSKAGLFGTEIDTCYGPKTIQEGVHLSFRPFSDDPELATIEGLVLEYARVADTIWI